MADSRGRRHDRPWGICGTPRRHLRRDPLWTHCEDSFFLPLLEPYRETLLGNYHGTGSECQEELVPNVSSTSRESGVVVEEGARLTGILLMLRVYITHTLDVHYLDPLPAIPQRCL